MVKYIVAATFAAALVFGVVGPVRAGYNCQQIGNQTFCNGPGGNVTCTRIGNQTFCN